MYTCGLLRSFVLYILNKLIKHLLLIMKKYIHTYYIIVQVELNKILNNFSFFQSKFHSEESSIYVHHVTIVQRSYQELVSLSNKRLNDLEMLQDFIQSATTELIWLNEKEEIEVSRDWSSKSLNVTEIERYYEVNHPHPILVVQSEKDGMKDYRRNDYIYIWHESIPYPKKEKKLRKTESIKIQLPISFWSY